MSMNNEMDRYLRGRRRKKAFAFINQREGGASLWSRLFAPRPLVEEDYTPSEKAQLHAMETEIKKGEKKLEQALPSEESELAEMQEERVSLYTKFTRLFQREHKVEDAYEQLETAPVTQDVTATEDFRKLAQIQMRWLERMPTRVKDEFKESDDYKAYVEILQRRGVAKRK
jgi:hypothetical protein